MRCSYSPWKCVAILALACLGLVAVQGRADSSLFDRLEARNIGPANMGGRIVDLAVVETNPAEFYVAVATGGLWKTINGGDSLKPIFDNQSTLSLGAVAVARSAPNIVWVGTGEANPRNSVSWGNGVYKSTDGGQSWRHMGLKENQHVGRIAIHPSNPDIVLVAALGRVWGPSKERGLYRTTDGGKTWTLAKFIDEDTGFIDVAIDPLRPEIAYAAAWTIRRDAFSGGSPRMQWGPKGGLFRSTDSGKTWEKMTNGLPSGAYGRCGLSIYQKDPRIVYAVVQTDTTDGPNDNKGQVAKEGNGDVEKGGIFRSDDRGTTWTKVNALCPRPFYYGQIRVDPSDDQRIYVLGISFHISSDGGKKFSSAKTGAHPDHHALWIDPKDPKHLILGNDGGLYVSKTRGTSFVAKRGMAIGQFYGIGVDMGSPYKVYGGLQDNGSWGGPVATDRAEGILMGDWKRVGGGDGFQAQIDPTDRNTVYVESQYGRPIRVDAQTGKGKSIRPFGNQKAAIYRFNWNSPMLLSPHDSKTLYYGGNVLFKSVNRGDTWEKISGDLTRRDPNKLVNGNTLTTIAESPRKAGLLWVGSDDGKVHLTRDGGTNWVDVSDKIPGPADRWITRVECSPFDEGTAFVTIDRHRNDDHKPYVFRTTDFGDTWVSLAGGLPPDASVHVIRQSSRNKDLLFAGTEFGLFGSLDAGKTWQRFQAGLPPAVLVHDLVIHPRERDLVIGTHARSIYVMDIGPLEDLTEKTRQAPAHLCSIRPTRLRKAVDPPKDAEPPPFAAANPPEGAVIWYHLREEAKDGVKLTVTSAENKEVTQMAGPGKAGLNRVVWKPEAKGAYKVALNAAGRSETRMVTVE